MDKSGVYYQEIGKQDKCLKTNLIFATNIIGKRKPICFICRQIGHVQCNCLHIETPLEELKKKYPNTQFTTVTSTALATTTKDKDKEKESDDDSLVQTDVNEDIMVFLQECKGKENFLTITEEEPKERRCVRARSSNDHARSTKHRG